MFRFFPYILKGLWRHRGRTALTVSGSAVALFLFCLVAAAQRGLERLADDRDATRSLIVFQENRFCPATSKLPEDYAETIAKLPGVDEVVPIKVFTNNCRASLDVVIFNGLPPEKIRTSRKLTLIEGDWAQFDARGDAAIAGRALALRRQLSVGQKFTIGEVTTTIAGIFTSDTPAEENLLYTRLAFLQRAKGKNQTGIVTQFEVRVADGAEPHRVAAAIDERFRTGPIATTTRPKGAFQRATMADFAELISLAHWLGYACVGLVLALVATTTVMTVQDRVSEHALLQAIGLRPGRVFRFVMAQSVMQSLAGGLLGIAAATALLAFGNFAIGAEGVSIAFQPSLYAVVAGVIVALAVGILSSLLPGWQAARAEIVAALRQA